MATYIISFDENHQPYISHAFVAGGGGAGRGVRQNHKYLLKIGEGRLARYFYTPAEVAAYKRELQNTTKSTAQANQNVHTNLKPSREKNVTGTAKPGSIYRRGDGLNKTKKEKEFNEAVDALKDYKFKQTEREAANNRLKENAANMMVLLTARRNLAKNRAAFEEAYGPDISKMLDAGLAEISRDTKNSAKATIKATGSQIKSGGKFLKETGDFAVEAAKDAADKKKDEVTTNLKSKTERMKEKFRKTTDGIVDKTKDKLGYDERERRDAARKSDKKIQKVAEDEIRKGTDKISKSIYETDKQKSDELFERGINQRNMAMNASERSKNKVSEAEKAYDKTLLGKAENTKEFIKDKATDAELAAWEVGKSVKDAGKSVKDAVDNAAFEVEYAAEKAINKVTGNKDAAERDYYLKAIEDIKKEARGAGKNRNEYYYKPLIEQLQEKADAADKRYKNSAVGKLKTKAERMKEKFKK